MKDITGKILEEIHNERQYQDAKWGEQNHPLLCPVLTSRNASATRHAVNYEVPTADRAKFNCDHEHHSGNGSYFSILIEEVCEAIEAAAESAMSAREELIQVAAVAVAMVEKIDRDAEGEVEE